MRSLRKVIKSVAAAQGARPGTPPAGSMRSLSSVREQLPVERYLAIMHCLATYGYRPRTDRHGRMVDEAGVLCEVSGNRPAPDTAPVDQETNIPLDARESPFLQAKDQGAILDKLIAKVLPDAKPDTEDVDRDQARKRRLIESKSMREADDEELLAMANAVEVEATPVEDEDPPQSPEEEPPPHDDSSG